MQEYTEPEPVVAKKEAWCIHGYEFMLNDKEILEASKECSLCQTDKKRLETLDKKIQDLVKELKRCEYRLTRVYPDKPPEGMAFTTY